MKFQDLLRFIEYINSMLNLKLCSFIYDWDTEDHKQDLNNHTVMLGTLDVIYHLILICWLTTRGPLFIDNF